MRQGPHQSAQKSTSTGTGTLLITSSNKDSSTAKGSEIGGNGDLHFPQRPVLARYFAGIRFCWPQWLQARITGKKNLHHTNRRLIGGLGSSRSLHQQIKDLKAALPFLLRGMLGLGINDGKGASHCKP